METTQQVDNICIHPYTLRRLLEESAKQGAEIALKQVNLEKCISTEKIMNTPFQASTEEGEAVEMAKRQRQRVEIGRDETGKARIKWVEGDTRQALIVEAAKVLINAGLIEKPVGEQKDIPLFKNYAEQWLKTYKESALRFNTLLGYRSYLAKHIYPAIGEKSLIEVKTSTIQSLFNQMAGDGKAKSTIDQTRIILHQIFDLAVEDGYIAKNPLDSLHLKNPSHKVDDRQALTPAELKTIVDGITKLPKQEDRYLLALFLYAGLRRGEALAIQWQDIDIEQGLIHVRHGVTFQHNKGVVGMTKSKAGNRDIPLLPQLLDVLSPEGKTGLVLHRDGKPLSEQAYRRVWERIGKTIDLSGITAHRLRHSFATIAANSGVEIKSLQAMLGHADIKTTMQIYVHAQKQQIKLAGNKMTNAFDNLA